MKKYLNRYQEHWALAFYSRSTVFGIVLLISSLLINHAASLYAVRHASNAVSDLFLDNLPYYDTGLVYFQGAVVFVIFVAVVTLSHPKHLPFVLKSLTLFILVRAFFITLTHLGTGNQISMVDNSTDGYFLLTGDLFFSGHTGFPFLFALMFWEHYWLRCIFLGISVIAGSCMLLGHYHYSIDVFAAFFITHTIFHLCKIFFKKDYLLFQHGITP